MNDNSFLIDQEVVISRGNSIVHGTIVSMDISGEKYRVYCADLDAELNVFHDDICCDDTLYYCPEFYVSNIQTEDSRINPMNADINFCVQCGWRIDAEVLISQPFLKVERRG